MVESVVITTCCIYTQGRTETSGRPGQANNISPLETDILQKFVQHLFSGGKEKLFFF
jgi:hypothetical protein